MSEEYGFNVRMTPQAVFDKCARHLLTQRKKAINYNWQCAYRGAGHTACAVGCFIPDDLYFPNIEGKVVYDLFTYYYSNRPFGLFLYMHEALLNSLQGIHDSKPASTWREELKYLAKRYKLKTDVLDQMGS